MTYRLISASTEISLGSLKLCKIPFYNFGLHDKIFFKRG